MTLDHLVENKLSMQKRFDRRADVDETDLKCEVTDITADAYVVVTNNLLSCRTISKSSTRLNGTKSKLDIHYNEKDSYFLRAYSSNNAWFSVVSQSVAKPGNVVRTTLQYQGNRRVQTRELRTELIRAIGEVSGAEVTETVFVEK